jgi:carboxylesterase
VVRAASPLLTVGAADRQPHGVNGEEDLDPARSLSHVGSQPWGALVLHGFTGSPHSVRPVAEAFRNAGFHVELPRLVGHGTTVADLLTRSWNEWTEQVLNAHDHLAKRCDATVVVGLSMGGALALWSATHRHVAAAIVINPKVVPEPADVREMAAGMVAEGELVIPSRGSDIAQPGAIDHDYDELPLPQLLSMLDGLDALDARLVLGAAPLLIMTSAVDHVVPTSDSDHLAERWGGRVERIRLDRSFHVATLDHDAEVVRYSAVDFAVRALMARRPDDEHTVPS